MPDTFTFLMDGRSVVATAGQSILEAAEAGGIYVPRLCHKPGLVPWGACRICTVRMNDRPCAACTQPAVPGSVVENDTEELRAYRRTLVEMLFVEGNHFCMLCEKSGNCELQALAYRLGVTAPRAPYFFQARDIDASHPDIILDRNRCIQCARCIRTSKDLDGKNVFGFLGRGTAKRIGVNARVRLRDTEVDLTDLSLDACPVGALLRKREGFRVPVGDRLYDLEPIGSDIERNSP